MRRLWWVGVVLAGIIGLAGCKVSDNGPVGQQEQAPPQGQQLEPAQGFPQGGQNGGPGAGPTIDPTAAAAFQDVNRLAVGMLVLQDANTHPLTKDQAATLLPLWKDIQAAMQPPQGQDQNGTPAAPPQGQDQTPGANSGGPGGFQGQGGGFRRGFFGDATKIEGDVASIRAALTQEQISDINALTQDEMTATLQKHAIAFGFGFGGGQGGGRNGGGGFQNGFGGTPGAFGTARAEGTFPARPTPDANELATFQARPTPDADTLATQQARRAQGNPLIAAVITALQALAGG